MGQNCLTIIQIKIGLVHVHFEKQNMQSQTNRHQHDC